jgi:hypothetical protein
MSDGAAAPISWDGRAPLSHREAGADCPRERAEDAGLLWPCGDAAALPGNPCAQDSYCTAGQDGRCLCEPVFSAPPGSAPDASDQLTILYNQTFCSYDECFVDSDCGPRVPCDCRDPNIYGNPNVCLSASNCAVDSDCPPPAFCSLSELPPGQTPNIGYFCHTPNDTCIDDADCPSNGALIPDCGFDPTSGIWLCFEMTHTQ